MKRLLITGFDPFGGEAINPSWEAVRALPARIGAYEIEKMEIPTVYGGAARKVLERAENYQPNVILCIGQAGGRAAVTPEVIAINLEEASIPDNAGVICSACPIIEDGPAAFFSTVDVREMVAAIRKQGIPATLSYSAGAFVCNDTLYRLLYHYRESEVKVGFIHLPFLPEQAGEGRPSLTREEMIRALCAAIEVLR